jgi:hypothetical protein
LVTRTLDSVYILFVSMYTIAGISNIEPITMKGISSAVGGGFHQGYPKVAFARSGCPKVNLVAPVSKDLDPSR